MVMAMWARIESDAVAEITEIDPAGRYHSSLQWVPCDVGVAPGWTYINGVLSEPVTERPTREQIEASRLRAYADPINGSDRHFAEATRMKTMGEEGWESVFEVGARRYIEIKDEWPWPDS